MTEWWKTVHEGHQGYAYDAACSACRDLLIALPERDVEMTKNEKKAAKALSDACANLVSTQLTVTKAMSDVLDAMLTFGEVYEIHLPLVKTLEDVE